MEDFPSNSQRARKPSREEEKPNIADPKKVERVIEGEVIRRKRPLGKRVKESLFGGDGPTVWEYVMADIFIPGIRDMFADVVTGGIERMLYGESRSAHRRIRPGSMPARVNYSGFASQPVGRAFREDPRQPLSRRARAAHDFEEIIIPSRSEAEMVLSSMFDVLERYDEVTVANLYELVGIPSNYAEVRYGWTDLRGSRIERISHGYLLNLPRPELLER
jgi:hypothetical protein